MKNEKTVFTPPTFDYAEKRHMTATGKLLRNSNLNLDGLTPAERLSMQEVTQEALFELSYSLSGTSLATYEAACSLEGGDKEWRQSSMLQELQALCLLADLLTLVENYNQDVKE